VRWRSSRLAFADRAARRRRRTLSSWSRCRCSHRCAIASCSGLAEPTPRSPRRSRSSTVGRLRRSARATAGRCELRPLPAEPFVVGQRRVARDTIDYHIAVDGHFYSVPYRLAQQKLDVFVTAIAVTGRPTSCAPRPLPSTSRSALRVDRLLWRARAPQAGCAHLFGRAVIAPCRAAAHGQPAAAVSRRQPEASFGEYARLRGPADY
jgi:hypothetical protein